MIEKGDTDVRSHIIKDAPTEDNQDNTVYDGAQAIIIIRQSISSQNFAENLYFQVKLAILTWKLNID